MMSDPLQFVSNVSTEIQSYLVLKVLSSGQACFYCKFAKVEHTWLASTQGRCVMYKKSAITRIEGPTCSSSYNCIKQETPPLASPCSECVTNFTSSGIVGAFQIQIGPIQRCCSCYPSKTSMIPLLGEVGGLGCSEQDQYLADSKCM